MLLRCHALIGPFSLKPIRLVYNDVAKSAETTAERPRSSEAERIAMRTRELAERLMKDGMPEERAPYWANEFVERELQAIRDPLTQLYNRRYFDEVVQAEVGVTGRYGRNVSLVLMDADHFKRINDSLGHPVGDAVLRLLSWIIQQECRNMDVPARFGGEEFVVVLPETTMDGAKCFADRLRASIERQLRPLIRKYLNEEAPEKMADFEDIANQIGTVSIGVSDIATSKTADGLVRDADHALYKAKEGGRNIVVVAGAAGLPAAGSAKAGAMTAA